MKILTASNSKQLLFFILVFVLITSGCLDMYTGILIHNQSQNDITVRIGTTGIEEPHTGYNRTVHKKSTHLLNSRPWPSPGDLEYVAITAGDSTMTFRQKDFQTVGGAENAVILVRDSQVMLLSRRQYNKSYRSGRGES